MITERTVTLGEGLKEVLIIIMTNTSSVWGKSQTLLTGFIEGMPLPETEVHFIHQFEAF
jgi:hypothetical protein